MGNIVGAGVFIIAGFLRLERVYFSLYSSPGWIESYRTLYILPSRRAQGSIREHEHGLRSCSSWDSWIGVRFVSGLGLFFWAQL